MTGDDPSALEIAPSFWSGRRVLVTGATGMLGSALVRDLVARGAVVSCLLRTAGGSHRSRELPPSVSLLYGRLEDLPTVVETVQRGEFSAVFHLGGQSLVGPAQRTARLTFEANIRGTWNVLEACRLCSDVVDRVVFASSEGVYGQQSSLPWSEEVAVRPARVYDVSKACGEIVAESYWRTYGLPVAITRCTHLYGPGDRNFARLIPGTIRSALRGESPAIRSGGEPLREYLFVGDAVDAYLRLAERIGRPGYAGQAFNIGSGSSHRVNEVVRTILRLTDRSELSPRVMGESANEAPYQAMESSKARTRLDWSPRFSLEAGLAATIPWYRGFLSGAGG